MLQETTPKSTPNRKTTRRSRGGRQKTYVSENDISSYKSHDIAAPRTPLKSVGNVVADTADAATTSRVQSTNQKHKNRSNKNRGAKAGSASPSCRQDGDSPPFQSREPWAPAFAGSSFHASPAPSALPLPKFLGPPNAEPPMMEARSISTSSESSHSTDSDDAATKDPIRRDDSPLEFFFRADRAEKARGRRASSANIDATAATATPSPFRDLHHPKERNVFPKTIGHTALRRPIFTESDHSSDNSTLRSGSDSRLSIGPTFSTPYQERIRAAQSNHNSPQQFPPVNQQMGPNSSEALKQYLFTNHIGRSKPQELPPQFSPSSHSGDQASQGQPGSGSWQYGVYRSGPHAARGIFPVSALAGHSPRAQATPFRDLSTEVGSRSQDIIALEGDLRRKLKIDSLG
ncbi:hypothetical protein F4808DRAFT_31143 [Astrocystis sublimbata]|nr:hypothetical protein F4808DRAFT_31143 [Astrocystis sublimbata]